MDINEYYIELMQELRTDAALNNTDSEDEFINKMFEIINELGEAPEITEYYFRKKYSGNRTMQINGYTIDSIDNSLVLAISDFETGLEIIETNRARIEDVLYKRVLNFLDMSYKEKLNDFCDDSDEILNISRLINNKLKDKIAGVLKIKVFIITNKKISGKFKKIKQGTFLDKPVEINILHLERLLEYEISNMESEVIKIDFMKDFNNLGIPCLEANIGNNIDYMAYTGIIQGKLLGDIYIEYGSKILEGNVRAFLGIIGSRSVNSGIKKTIIQEPDRFFTYNNGVAITASNVNVCIKDGQTYIVDIEDMQIINGGQTTATIATMILKNDHIENLTEVYVPVKITVIKDRDLSDLDGTREYDKMVANISKYANSQNKVTAADFFSNHPYHIEMEKLSKKLAAPPKLGTTMSTYWYYERSRKKYEQEQMKMTKSEKNNYQKKYPKKQVIKKDKLAKCIYSVECKPHLVVKGANFVIKDFSENVNKIMDEVNERYFKKCVCYVIMFNEVDSIVANADWYNKGGYKSNIIPYAISMFMTLLPNKMTLDWDYIWSKQTVGDVLRDELDIIAQKVNIFISDSKGVIVNEYCKKEDTWNSMKDTFKHNLSEKAMMQLKNINDENQDEKQAKKEQKNNKEIENEMEIYKYGDKFWFDLLVIGNENEVLNITETELLKLASKIHSTGKPLTSNQARKIMKIKEKIEEYGLFIE